MSKIQNISEPWNGHTFAEVQEFIKASLGYNPGETVAIDLGLSSGTKWADRNVGATSPEDFGFYFSWGNVDGHKSVFDYAYGLLIEDGYIFSGTYYGDGNWIGSYDKTPGSALSDTNIVPGFAAYDAARANLGSPWKMPTSDQFNELITNTTRSVTERNGIFGMLFTSNINGNSIFFPFAGCVVDDQIINIGGGGSGSGSGSGSGGSFGYFYSTDEFAGGSAKYLQIQSVAGGYATVDTNVKSNGCSIRAVQ